MKTVYGLYTHMLITISAKA